MAGIEKKQWLWNTRANDTGSIVDVLLSLFDSRLRGALYGLPPRLVNLLSLVRLRTFRVLDATA
jgi:hypothetical protein